ncbi:putative patatin-like phospholipase [hydrothermal vent metagenome]|uniref:Putative patatin-like phospholipase n=1 Tax=hydrothermal vent metagenome TaxID=652676 RepID=A0A3B1CGB6_9ZZZZ
MLTKFRIAVLLFLFAPIFIIAQQDTLYLTPKLESEQLPFGLKTEESACYPKVGLALSGGGARGIATLGVLKALKENNIPLEYIVGTSMGSIIGGLYSAGYTLTEIDSIMQATDWNDFYRFSETNRNELFLDQKVTEDIALFSVRFDGLTPVVPTSFNTGQQFLNYLNYLTLNAPLHVAHNDFNSLRFKFRAVSTDLGTGKLIMIKHGSLSKALRASSSVSFLLEPVHVDSMLLVDGGVVANVPTKPARDVGSDYVIAVNTTSPLRKREDLDDPLKIADQLVSIPISMVTKENLKYADVTITPALGNKKNDDFTNLDSLIRLGYKATLPQIKKIKKDLKNYSLENSSKEIIYFYNIQPYDNNSKLESQITEKFAGKDSVSNRDILVELGGYFNSGDFEFISAKLIKNKKTARIKIDYKYKPLITSIKVVGAEKIALDKIYGILNSLNGKRYNEKKISQKLIDLLRFYRKNGLSLADINSVSFDKASGLLTIDIDEGRINSIIIKGNKKTNDAVILREFPMRKGEYFTADKLFKGLKSLRTTGLFKSIDIRITNAEIGKNVEIVVEEKISSLARFGLKADNERYVQFSIDVRDENLFGTGTEIGALFFGGLRNQLVVAEHKANRIFNTYLTYKLKGYFDLTDINTYKDNVVNDPKRFSRTKNGEYRQKKYGVSLGVGMQAEKFGNLIANFRYETNYLRNIAGDNITPEKFDLAVLKFSMTIDTQDKYPYPNSGSYFDTYYETSQKIFGADISYSLYSLKYVGYFSLSKSSVLTPSIQVGVGDETLPLSQQFGFGGQYSFLGYREYEYRGRQIFIGSLQYRFKLPFKIWFDAYITARYDVGNIWERKEEMKFKDFKQGLGAVLSFNTPVGPADFAIGRSFLIDRGITKGNIVRGPTLLYFTIGYFF